MKCTPEANCGEVYLLDRVLHLRQHVRHLDQVNQYKRRVVWEDRLQVRTVVDICARFSILFNTFPSPNGASSVASTAALDASSFAFASPFAAALPSFRVQMPPLVLLLPVSLDGELSIDLIALNIVSVYPYASAGWRRSSASTWW